MVRRLPAGPNCSKGVGGFKREAEEKLAQLTESRVGDLEKIYFLKAEITAAEGIIALANRHADLAEQMAGNVRTR